MAFADRREVAREHVLCMQALWSEDQAEYHGDYVVARALLELAQAGPAATGDHPDRRGRPPRRCSPPSPSTPTGGCPSAVSGLAEALPELRRAVEVAGRDPEAVRVVPFGTVPDDGQARPLPEPR